MNEEEIIEFIDQLYGVEREYYNLVRVKNTENIITAIKSAIILYQHEKEKNKKLEEVINTMAKDISISNLTNWEVGCNYEIKGCECMNGPVRKCEDCIKEYYFKKARGEENE